jgi:quinol monooxygenase YgiN
MRAPHAILRGMMIRVVAHLTARPDKIEALKTMVLALAVPTRLESGCRKYEWHQNTADPTDITCIEEWESDQALNEHLASPHVTAALKSAPDLTTGVDIRRYQFIG